MAASVSAMGLAASVVRSTVGLGSEELEHAFSDWVYPLLYVPPAFVCFLRWHTSRSDGLAWLGFGFGFLLWAAGWLSYTGFVHHEAEPPYPSVADMFWLAFYPVVYVALGSLLRARAGRVPRSVWLDGVVGALALAAIAAAFLVEPIVASWGGGVQAVATSVAYPVGDLALLLTVLTMFALCGWRPDRSWVLIGVALLIQVVTDLIYLYGVAAGTWGSGTLLDSSWLLVALLVARAAWLPPGRAGVASLDGWAVLLVPSVLTVLALTVLVYGNFDPDTSEAASVLACAAVAASSVRGGAAFREQRRLRRVARLDPLTGLLNHGAFHAVVEHHIAAADHGRFSVVLFDLDGFKEINDRRGHAEGDRVLRGVAEALGDSCRPNDVAGRVGGDEFALLLGDVDSDGATAVAARVAREVARREEGIGASFGVGEWPADGPGKEMLLMRADVALYASKAGNRPAAGDAESTVARRAGDLDDSGKQRRGEAIDAHESMARAQLEAYASDVRKSYARELARTQQLHESYLATVQTLAAAVEAKDEYTGGHIQRVHALGLLLAGAMVPDEAEHPQLSYGLLLHDVGKLSVPDAVLNKPGKLDAAEWELMRAHPEEGARILAAIPFLGRALDVVRHHHERWDGGGYPSGLRGEEIPLWARMFALVDAVDAMTSDRPYRRGRTLEEALSELRNGAGSQFDPRCVTAFEALPPDEVRALLQHGGLRGIATDVRSAAGVTVAEPARSQV